MEPSDRLKVERDLWLSSACVLRLRLERGGILFNLLVLLVGLAAVAALAWMLFLPAFAARLMAERTGFGVRIERLAANPFTAQVKMIWFALDNPPAYPSRDFVQVRAFEADGQLFTLLGRKPVIDDLVVDVACVSIIKNPDGVSNLDLLRSRLATASGGGEGDAPPKKAPRSAEKPEFLVKRLELRFDRLLLTDLTAPRTATREFKLGFSHTYANISDPAQLLVPALFRSIGEAGGTFEGLVPSRFAGHRGGGPELLGEASRRVSDAFKSLFRKLEDSPKP